YPQQPADRRRLLRDARRDARDGSARRAARRHRLRHHHRGGDRRQERARRARRAHPERGEAGTCRRRRLLHPRRHRDRPQERRYPERHRHLMFRFGILGASYFATHKMIPAMQAVGDTPVVAIASRDGKKAAETARALGIPKTHDSYEALLADPDVDGVYIPLPNHLHVPWAEQAAAAGKHVLVEKPIALGAAEARRLIAARDAHKVLIAEAAMT